jgi:hypothetical protein
MPELWLRSIVAYIVLMSIEGVIAEDTEQLQLAQMMPAGKILLYALKEMFSVWLSSVDDDEKLVIRWLQECGIGPEDYQRLLTGITGVNEDGIRKEHFKIARRAGDLKYVIDPDPEIARYVLLHGVTPMCCPNPAYARYSFLPDSQEGAASWDAILADVVGQRGVRLADKRADEVEEETL